MPSVTVSAPGKLFLLGEHAVVYNGTCLVTAVDSRLWMTLTAEEATHNPTLTIIAPDVGLTNWSCLLKESFFRPAYQGPSAFIESCLAVFHRRYPFHANLTIETRSDFGANLGLGSSSATVAATLYGLSALFHADLSPDQLFTLGVEAIQNVQKLGSGADLAAAIYGGTLYYLNHFPRQITPLAVDSLPLLVVYSGEKAGTVSYVRKVAELEESWPNVISAVIETMFTIVDSGRECLLARDWVGLGQLMNIQHGLLHALGVDTPSLSEIVFAARNAGALGAKLSGAGGGDCAIVLVDDTHRSAVIDALANKKIVNVQANAAGVRLEKA